jgi:ubiquinone/menaquinone biosynthesis C-methylase UbiE
VEYCRDTARRLRNLQDLALRGKNKEALTRRVQERIVQEVALTADDDIVDIGCGDGTLLLLAKKAGVRSATGFHATEEESAIVRSLGVDARQGYTDSLPLADECASVVVCNNVLLIVPRETIPASLREIHRVAKPGARVLIGKFRSSRAHRRSRSSSRRARRWYISIANMDCGPSSECCAG